ncbi:MAG: type-F conjugative transfer system secretin TraK [Deltaproteobacteria bacterium]|nr:type-F conjugative transfer system secretin TraK [Deltaproteobacteria bacterium]
MNRKFIFVVGLLVLSCVGTVSAEYATSEQMILPEEIASVQMSGIDINRIVCPVPIQDVIFSPEKGITVKVSGKDAFLKFLVKKEGENDVPLKPVELYVVCDEATYTLIAMPSDLRAQTVRLSASKANQIKKSVSYLKGLAFEDKVTRILKEIYQDQFPSSFIVHDMNQPIDIFQEIRLTLLRTITIEGEGLIVKEYLAEPRGGVTTVTLQEKDFIIKEIALKPVAISMDKLQLESGQKLRVLVVEKSAAHIE